MNDSNPYLNQLQTNKWQQKVKYQNSKFQKKCFPGLLCGLISQRLQEEMIKATVFFGL
jgi:hypothetical protein